MTSLGAGRLALAGTLGSAAAMAAMAVGSLTACSSSSAGAAGTSALSSDAGADASVGSTGVAENFDAPFDGQSNLTLKWQVTLQPAPGYGYGDSGVGVNQGTGDGGLDTLPGVQVCIYGNSSAPCTTTDDNGLFVLGGLSPRTNTVISLTKSGYSSILKAILTGSADMDGTSNPIRMILNSDPQPPIGMTVEWSTTGVLAFFALGPQDGGAGFTADVGASVTLSPSGGTGPYYVTGDGYFDDAGTALESGGLGYYYNVPPGNYTLTFHDSVHNCAPIDALFGGYGFPDPPTSVQFPIVAGYTTELVGVICTAKPLLVEAGP